MNLSLSCLRVLALLLCLGVWLPPARAGALEVAPVSHDLAPGQTLLSMTVSNRADAPCTLQVRGFVWTQEDGEDRLVPTDALLIAPAIFSIEPKRGQVLRVRVPATAAGREASYRLVIDELPPPGDAGHVRMALRLSVPVFAHGAMPTPARLSARIDAAHGLLTLVNEGGTRARVHRLALIVPGGEHLAATPKAGPYVLAGAARAWSFAPDGGRLPAGAAPSLVALTDGGRIEVPLVAAP